MREQWAEVVEGAVVSDVHEVIVESVEVYESAPEPEVTPSDLVALLVAHFEESLIRKEHELIALRRSVEDSERDAAEIQHALRQELNAAHQELATANQITRILERENQRLTTEVEALRLQVNQAHSQDEAARLVTILERENQRLLAELETLRTQLAAPSVSDTDETLLEELLEREVGASVREPVRNVSPARRFRKRPASI